MPNWTTRSGPRFEQHDFAAVEVAVQPAIENPHVYPAVVVRLHRDGHVMVVNEHPPVRLGQHFGGDMLRVREHRLRFRKNIHQRFKLDVRVHGFLQWRGRRTRRGAAGAVTVARSRLGVADRPMFLFKILRQQRVDLQQAATRQPDFVPFDRQITGGFLVRKRSGELFQNVDAELRPEWPGRNPPLLELQHHLANQFLVLRRHQGAMNRQFVGCHVWMYCSSWS